MGHVLVGVEDSGVLPMTTGVDVVIVKFDPDVGAEGVVLEDEAIYGDWREWMGSRLLLNTVELYASLGPTAIPGVSLVGQIWADRGSPNYAAWRIVTGVEAQVRLIGGIVDTRVYGPAIAFGYTRETQGGSPTRLSGSQRVAIEAAAYREWVAFHRAVMRLREVPVGHIPPKSAPEDDQDPESDQDDSEAAPPQPSPVLTSGHVDGGV